MMQESIQSTPRGSVNTTFHCTDNTTEISEWIGHLQDMTSPGFKPESQNNIYLYSSNSVKVLESNVIACHLKCSQSHLVQE